MAQYCRYCEHLYNEMNGYYCAERERYMSEKSIRHSNTCDRFQLNRIDAMRLNQIGYKPTGRMIMEFGGLGKQVRMEEFLGGEE